MKNKKLLSLALAAALVSGTAFGATSCSKKFADDDNALEIYVAKLGYGDEWLQKAAKRFAEFDYVKETYPNFQYKIFANDEYTFGQEQVKSGATTYDLLFCSSFSLSTVEVAGPNGEKSVLEDLTSLFNSKIPDYANGGYEKNDAGEEWTYGEKLKKNNPGKFAGLAYKEDENGETVDIYYYSAYDNSKYGILYNKTIMKEKGYLTEENGEVKGLPRTTQELYDLAQKIKSGGDMAFISSADTGYWMRIQNLWWAQYEGAEAFEHYFDAEYKNDEGEWVQGVECLNSQGRLKAAQTVEKLLWYPSGMIYNESAALDFTTAQAYLITGKGLMQANGDWFDSEMAEIRKQEGGDKEIGMMPDPILSDIIEVVPDRSIENDAELSALVGAIRNGSTELSGTFEGQAYSVTQADYDYIAAACNLYNSGEQVSPVVIPSYASAKKLAKDFMLYLASDEFLHQYCKTLNGCSPAFYYDVKTKDPALFESFSDMQKERINYIKGKSSIYAFKTSNKPLVYRTSYAGLAEGFEEGYFAKNPGDRKTAKQAIEAQIKTYTENTNEMWNLLFISAGLK